jgi:hypothetical protein
MWKINKGGPKVYPGNDGGWLLACATGPRVYEVAKHGEFEGFSFLKIANENR